MPRIAFLLGSFKIRVSLLSLQLPTCQPHSASALPLECTGPEPRQFRVPSLGDVTEPCTVTWALSMKLSSLLTLPCLGPVYCSHGPGFLCRYCCLSEITEVKMRPPCSGFSCLVCGGFRFHWGRGCGLTVHLVPSAQPLTLSSGDTERTMSISSSVLCGVGHLLLGQWVSRGRHGGRHSLFASHPHLPFLPSGILLSSGSCGQERTVLAADVESKLVTSNMLRLQTWALVIVSNRFVQCLEAGESLGASQVLDAVVTVPGSLSSERHHLSKQIPTQTEHAWGLLCFCNTT